MADTVVYALIIYAVGCIIPTPLDQQGAQIDQRPFLRSDKADPPFGPISHAQDDLFELSIAADDPDPDDELHARLFSQDSSGKLIYLGNNEIVLTTASVPDPNDPTLRQGTFAAQTFCLGRSTTLAAPLLLYVVVADRPFSATDPSMVVQGGFTDSSYWTLTCM